MEIKSRSRIGSGLLQSYFTPDVPGKIPDALRAYTRRFHFMASINPAMPSNPPVAGSGTAMMV